MKAHRYWRHASLVMVLSVFTFPAGAGHLVVSANDGKWPSIDGDYYAADPPMPDTLVILDAAVFPPKVVGQVEVHHSVIAPPMAVAISPDETIALVSAPNRLNPDAQIVHGSRATNAWFIREPFIQVIDLEASPPRLIDRVALSTQAYGVSINKAGTLALAGHIEGTVSVLAIEGKRVTLVETLKIGEPKSRLSHVAFTPDGKWALACSRMGWTFSRTASSPQSPTGRRGWRCR